MNIEEIVLKTLQEAKEPLKTGDIAQITGLDKKEVEKAIKKLKKEGLVNSPKRCYYSAK